ncbi:MAG: hypothetical protein BWX72_00469 [Firmicutes bacterium ADurb.Bin080]|jgi:hypothetical protein|nr:MAG: hypothetical protein BWX72_00469 [Firmicutes bacterium ADurb.Bin080]
MAKIVEENLNYEIEDLGSLPKLLSVGKEDEFNTQIFTPEFIVNNMIKLIGEDYVADVTKTVLEPASGDGAFTVRILKLRLEHLIGLKTENFLQKTLIALSTIYSIEMDKGLIKKQRNNIYSTLVYYAKAYNPEENYFSLAKKIISANFIWGKTNIDESKNEDGGGFLGHSVGNYLSDDKKERQNKTLMEKMNEPIKVSNNQIKFFVWEINPDLSYYCREEEVF